MVEGLSRLIEAEDDPSAWKQAPQFKKFGRDKDIGKDFETGNPIEVQPKDFKGSGKVHHTAIRKSGENPLGTSSKGKSPGWLSIYSPEAYKALRSIGSPDGQVFLDKGNIMFRPKDPAKRAMFWAALPEKRQLKGGEVVVPKEGEARAHAWRTYDELSMDQRQGLGWIEPRDRGSVKKAEEPKEEPGLGVRVRGFGNQPQSAAYNDEGWLTPAEAEVTGRVPGAEPVVAGKGGSVPSREAQAAAQRAFAAKHAKLPDWETLGLQDLHSWKEAVAKKYKTSQDPSDLRVFQAIRNALEDRRNGIPAKAVQRPMAPVKSDEPIVPREKTQRSKENPEDRWGKRRDWGKTSKDVQVDKVVRPPKK